MLFLLHNKWNALGQAWTELVGPEGNEGLLMSHKKTFHLVK